MSYTIKRECWNDKTYNGYTDKPYWRIDFAGGGYGLKDDGTLWSVYDFAVTDHVKERVRMVIAECGLNITLIGDNPAKKCGRPSGHDCDYTLLMCKLKAGESFFTTAKDMAVTASANYRGVKVTTIRYRAISPDSDTVVNLTKVTIIQAKEPEK